MSIQTAEQFEENEQYDEAYTEYKKLYEHKPNDLQILERLGHLAMMLNKGDEAAEYYSKILEQDATNTMAYEQLMDIYQFKDKYKYYIYRGNLHSVEHQLEHAINDFKKALVNAEDDKEIQTTRFVLASLYTQTGSNMKAIDEYLKLLDYEGIPDETYLNLANLYLKENALSSAVNVLERAFNKGIDSNNIRESLANLYIKNNECQKALDTTNDELTKAKCLLELNQPEEAFKILEENKLKYKTNSRFYSLLAQYYFVTEDYDKALENVNEFDKYEKNSPLTYQMRALIYENKKDEYNAHLNWGKYNLIRKNTDIAINEYLIAHQIKDDDVNLLTTLAVLLEENGDKNHSIEFYEKIASLEPNNIKALEKLADFRNSIGDYGMECDYLEKWYEADKRNYALIKRLAEAYARAKNKPSAVEFYKKYLQVAPNSEDYDKVKKALNKIENSDMVEDEGFLEKIIRFFSKS